MGMRTNTQGYMKGTILDVGVKYGKCLHQIYRIGGVMGQIWTKRQKLTYITKKKSLGYENNSK